MTEAARSKRTRIKVLCGGCDITYERRVDRIAATIRQRGKWQCFACANRIKLATMVRPARAFAALNRCRSFWRSTPRCF